MPTQIHKNIIVTGSAGRGMLTDIFVTGDKKRPVIIYAHGFNGFKDWGNFDLIAKQFAEARFNFVKFNFSHNGTTVEAPEEFADLISYANNNYTKELDDLKCIINWATDDANAYAPFIDVDKVYLLGHSMGGGIVILKANEDKRIKAIATWASIDECKTPWGKWPNDKLEQWKKEGVAYTMNSRTRQNMPLNYQLLQDYYNNEQRLNIKKAMFNLKIPVLLCHGTNDEAVAVETATDLHTMNKGTELFIVESDHVFGRKHPWTEEVLPDAMQEVLDRTIQFFKVTSEAT